NNTSSKIWSLNLINNSDTDRTFELIFYVEWVLGTMRQETFRYINTNVDKEGNFLYARNFWNAEFSNLFVSAGSNLSLQDFTTSRSNFLGPNASLDKPAALFVINVRAKSKLKIPYGTVLDKKVGFGFDSCAALKYEIELLQGEETNIVFFINT